MTTGNLACNAIPLRPIESPSPPDKDEDPEQVLPTESYRPKRAEMQAD